MIKRAYSNVVYVTKLEEVIMKEWGFMLEGKDVANKHPYQIGVQLFMSCIKAFVDKSRIRQMNNFYQINCLYKKYCMHTVGWLITY